MDHIYMLICNAEICAPEISTLGNIDLNTREDWEYSIKPWNFVYQGEDCYYFGGRLKVYEPQTIPRLGDFQVDCPDHHLNFNDFETDCPVLSIYK